MIETRLILKLGLSCFIMLHGFFLFDNVNLVQDIIQLERDVELLKPTLDGLGPSLQKDQIIFIAGVTNTLKYGGVACVVLGACYAIFSAIVELS